MKNHHFYVFFRDFFQKNDFFQKSKIPFLRGAQWSINANFQGYRPKDVTRSARTHRQTYEKTRIIPLFGLAVLSGSGDSITTGPPQCWWRGGAARGDMYGRFVAMATSSGGGQAKCCDQGEITTIFCVFSDFFPEKTTFSKNPKKTFWRAPSGVLIPILTAVGKKM